MHLHHHPHHDGSELYSTAGSEPSVRNVRVRVPRAFGPLASVWVRVVVDAEPRYLPMHPIPSPLAGDLADWWEGAIELLNPVVGYRFLLNRLDAGALWLNPEGVDEVEPLDAADFRVTGAVPPPEWASGQIMYQVFPDRFARSVGAAARALPSWAIPAAWDDEVIHTGSDTPLQVFGGDLDGVRERLGHLVDLGVTLIYLTPFFPAGSNHRYDATTFDRVDPLLGGDEALIRLVQAAHQRGIRVIGDLTTNHTGDRHEWFRAALGDPSAPEGAFYYWNDDAHTDYVAWYGVPTLPKLDWNSPELRSRFIEGRESVVAKWLLPPFELDGWRIDVANMTGRHGDDDLNRLVQRSVRRTMQEVAPDTVLFAESTNDATRDFDGLGWQAPMSYSAFTRPLWHWLQRPAAQPEHHFGIPYAQTPQATAGEFVRAHRRFTGSFPWPVNQLVMNALDTHDTPRFRERADEQLQRVAAGLSFALPGTPVLFAGDEFGLRGALGEEARTPLPWGTVPELSGFYAELSRLRRGMPALRTGGLRWLHAGDDSLAFVRETTDQSVLVVASRGDDRIVIPDDAIGTPAAALLASGSRRALERLGVVEIEVSGPAFGVWMLGAERMPGDTPALAIQAASR